MITADKLKMANGEAGVLGQAVATNALRRETSMTMPYVKNLVWRTDVIVAKQRWFMEVHERRAS